MAQVYPLQDKLLLMIIIPTLLYETEFLESSSTIGLKMDIFGVASKVGSLSASMLQTLIFFQLKYVLYL